MTMGPLRVGIHNSRVPTDARTFFTHRSASVEFSKCAGVKNAKKFRVVISAGRVLPIRPNKTKKRDKTGKTSRKIDVTAGGSRNATKAETKGRGGNQAKPDDYAAVLRATDVTVNAVGTALQVGFLFMHFGVDL